MRFRRALIYIVPLLVAILLTGCRADGTGVEAASEMLPSGEPLADLRFGDDPVTIAESKTTGENTGGSLGDDSFGPLGLLAPTFPTLGLDIYSTSCDPFDDPYGTCL